MKRNLLLLGALAIGAASLQAQTVAQPKAVSAADMVKISTSPKDADTKPFKAVKKTAVNVNAAAASDLDACYWPMPYCMYWGLSLDGNMSCINPGISAYPVYSPIEWMNMSDNSGSVTYSWTYDDPATREYATSDEQEVLSVTYQPTYSPEKYTRLNIYNVPTLIANESQATTEYHMTPSWLTAGGTAEYDVEGNGEYTKYGLLPFDLLTEGLCIYTKKTSYGGELGVPIFGHSDATDRWWNDYVFNGEPSGSNYAYLKSYANLVIAPAAPTVVRGAYAYAMGDITDEATLRIEIRSLDEDGVPSAQPIAMAVCTGDKVKHHPYTDGLDYLMLPFEFDTPLVLNGEASPNGYLVEIAGLRDGGINYYAPLQSLKPNAYEYAFGFYRLAISWNGDNDDSFGYVANFENEYGEFYSAFAIGLDITYPWLVCDTESVNIDNEAVTVEMAGYYDAADYKICLTNGDPLPQWLSATITGRFDNTVLTLSAAPETDVNNMEIFIGAPGVGHVLKLNCKASSVIDGLATDVAVKAAYTLTGQSVDASSLAPGVYLIHYTDGSVKTTLVK